MMNEAFVKDWEQNTGFCFIPDAKFPGAFWFGLGFLVESCSLMPRCFGRCFPGAVPLSESSKNWGEIPEFGVFNSCSILWRCHPCGCHSCLEPQGHEQYPALSLTLAVLFNGPKSSWLCSLRSFVHWQVGKGRVSLFSYYSFLLPLCVGFV